MFIFHEKLEYMYALELRGVKPDALRTLFDRWSFDGQLVLWLALGI